MSEKIEHGDYVVATKWSDGDLGDQYCVGFYDKAILDGDRHLVLDAPEGNQFRNNGFRRVQKITHDQGVFIIKAFQKFDDRKCVPPDVETWNIWSIVAESTGIIQ